MVRRRVVLVALAAVAVIVNALAGGDVMHRLAYLLAVLAVVFLFQTFWEDRNGPWVYATSGAMVVAMLVTITYTVNRTSGDDRRTLAEAAAEAGTSDLTSEAGDTATATGAAGAGTGGDVAAEPTTTLATGDQVPAEVAGAVEERTGAERLIACEDALARVAAAVESVGESVPSTTQAAPEIELERRLRSCEVRLRAIAATLPG